MSTSLETDNDTSDVVEPRCRTGQRVRILGIELDNLSMADAVQAIVGRLEGRTPSQVCFVNADCANIARRDEQYLAVLRQADIVLADGVGLKLAGLLEGVRVRENVNGTDLFPRLCARLSGSGRRIYLLGARPAVAEAVADWIARRYPGVVVAGCRHGYFSPEEEEAVVAKIAESKADVLLVGFGVPRQDLWIRRHLDALGVNVAVGVGGLFDFYSGRIPRAPLWMRKTGVEWLYRLYQEPRRLWKRYLIGSPLFMVQTVGDRSTRVLGRVARAFCRWASG